MTDEPDLPAGTKLAHYAIRRRLGIGAMGIVYEADDTALDRSVAVKVLRTRIASEPAFVERFFREARAAARVNHPGLVHVYFVGREGDRAFFAMEVVPGRTLEQVVAEEGALPADRVGEIVIQSARAFGAAHAMGVVHRDVKPSNLILRNDGVVKVTDFGLARSMDTDVAASSDGLTGTPTFMSPEQCRGRPADARSDIYSLGLVAWYLLAGKPPFDSPSLAEVLMAHLQQPLPPLPGGASADVQAVLARMCEKDPEKRPQTMEEVARLFDRLRPQTLHLAPVVTRGSAFLVDGVAGICVVAAVSIVTELLQIGSKRFAPGSGLSDAFGERFTLAAGSIAFAAVTLLPELKWGTSLGKRLFGLRLLREDGTKPGPLACLVRFLLRFPMVPINILLVVLPSWAVSPLLFAVVVFVQIAFMASGVVTFLLHGSRTHWDRVSRTVVSYELARTARENSAPG